MRNDRMPTLLYIGTMAWLSATAFTVAWYIASAPVLDGRHTAGFMMSMLSACLLLSQAVILTAVRATMRRDKARALAAGPAWLGEQMGTWSDQTPGGVVTVAWLSDRRDWWVEGWPRLQWRLTGENGKVDFSALRQMLAAIEEDGYLPYDDAGTWAVRRRLGIAGAGESVDTAVIRR